MYRQAARQHNLRRAHPSAAREARRAAARRTALSGCRVRREPGRLREYEILAASAQRTGRRRCRAERTALRGVRALNPQPRLALTRRGEVGMGARAAGTGRRVRRQQCANDGTKNRLVSVEDCCAICLPYLHPPPSLLQCRRPSGRSAAGDEVTLCHPGLSTCRRRSLATRRASSGPRATRSTARHPSG
jgi:hypothetical protein